jgi:ATP-dependent DNA helicase RecG
MIVNSIPNSITFEQFMGAHSSCPRNRLIARAFYLAGFIESWGRGINKIKTEFVENGLEAPVYKEEMGGMSVYITRKKGLYGEDGTVNDPVNDGVNDGVKWTRNELRILHEMYENNDITYIELQTKLKISEPTVRRAIKRLRINMMIVREGSDKSGHWYVTEKGKELL